ncbi:MAG: zinc ribbon domain-containing protein [Nitrososphaerota archaeon]|nr:zinc ribbon domain-containing protein [Candidatus Bathyarchaeota archaeon]MDW8048141.1 zinc ribbon domain-containing protein [Nitrososphaerota archaeon]
MGYCENCGFPLPEGAEFCPSCGIRIRRKSEAAYSGENLARILQSGITGAFLSLLIIYLVSAFTNADLYFLPSFLSSLLIIYFYRVRRFDEAVCISLAIYLFAEGMIAGLNLGYLYSNGIPLAEVYGDYVPTIVDVIMYASNPVTAVIAGYLGARLSFGSQPREATPVTVEGRREPGGVIYSVKRLAKSSHNA